MIGIGKRYILRGVLGKGGMGVVHRATDRLNREDVALKKVTTAPEQLTFNSQSDDIDNKLALAQEFRALATLRHPNIISVLDYGFDTDSRPYFTMELLDDPQTLINAGRNQSMDVKIDLLIQMLRALAYLHRRGIIHRDLKPSNLLVVRDMQNLPLLKVLDFGLSVVGKEDQKGSGGTTAGTLAYMAPEILQGAPVNNATDLYAVGIIAYELFSGIHPFDVQNIPKLIEDILKTYPDMSRLDVSEQVIVVLQRLMSKDPGGRYHDANQVIVDLCAATQHPLPQESAAIRDSFLQSARLVERDTELKILSKALADAQNGKGSAWLVTGESGVGKSRLIDELRTVAMVQGMLTLRGQSTSSGDTTVELWRHVIRRLSVFTEISNFEASIIKTIVPDINLLLERTIPEVTVSGGPVGERLFATVESIIQRLTSPTLLVLEDLHWAQDNLELLIRLNAMVDKLPLVIVGSYRDDERPDLPELLPAMKILKLQRLSENGIRELSTAMLGKAGERHHVVDLLQRETEGNVFFLVEVVRALAEEAGQLERIGMVTLPEQVFAGGVQQIVQRRLNRVPASSQYLLKLAAVGGRWLDLPVLEYALNAKQTRKSLATLLQECAAVAVFEVQDNQWRFVHDKLREAVLTNLTDFERPVLHGQMAEAIENVYENPVEKSAMLAQLWSVAGNREKQVDYLSLNGNAAMHNGVNREAAEVFEQVLEQLEHLQPTPYHQRRYIDTAIKLTRVSPYAPHSETLKSQLERAYNYARVQEDESRQAEVLSSLGIFYHMRGQLREALYYFAQAAELAEQHQARVVLMQIYSYMGRSMFFAGQLTEALPVLEKGIQLAEEYDSLELIAESTVYLALMKWFSGDKEAGDALAEQALETSESLAQPGLLAMGLTLLATGAAFCGWLERATDYLGKAIVLAEDQQDLLTVYIATLINGYVALQNDEMDKAFSLLEEAASLAQKQHIYLMMPNCMIWSAAIDAWYGNAPMARERIQVAEQLSEQTQQVLGLCEIYRVAARIYEGDDEKVKSYLDNSLKLARDLQVQPAIAAALYDLSSYYFNQGDTDSAQSSLEEASTIARQLDMQIWLTRLDALRANL